ncbi:MAG: DUF3570 domain-containing protein [Nitrospiria bacterium]
MRLRAVGTSFFLLILLVLASLILAPFVFAQTVDDEVEFRYHFYEDNRGLTVKTPYLILRKQVTEQTAVSLRYTYETFEIDAKEAAASVGTGGDAGGGEHDHEKSSRQKILMAVDGISGASAVAQSAAGLAKEIRQEVVASVSHQWGQAVVGGTYAFSDEDDYRSQAFGLSFSRDFLLRNTNLTAQYVHAMDDVNNLDRQPGETDWPRDKKTHGGTLVLTQILSPKSFVRLGYGITDVEGYQASPYRKVVINATRFDEIHPENRLRQTFFAWINRYFETRTSAHLNGTYYRDDWGVRAHSVEIKVYQYLSDPFVLRFRYRYYDQSKADFFNPDRTLPEAIMSADPKLRDFDANLYGIKFIYRFGKLPFRFLERIDIEAGFNRLAEPGGFHANISQAALRMVF